MGFEVRDCLPNTDRFEVAELTYTSLLTSKYDSSVSTMKTQASLCGESGLAGVGAVKTIGQLASGADAQAGDLSCLTKNRWLVYCIVLFFPQDVLTNQIVFSETIHAVLNGLHSLPMRREPKAVGLVSSFLSRRKALYNAL